MNIEIITTPNSALNETGFGNFNSCQNVLSSIEKMNHNSRISSCKSLIDLEQVLERKPDLVVLAVKYILIENDKKIWLSEYFKGHNIPYTGSTKSTIMFDSDKVLAKQHLRKKGVSTASFFTAFEGEFKSDKDLELSYPLFLKPINAANSNGIDDNSYVSSFDEFEQKVSSVKKSFGQSTLAEEYLSGKEYTVAMLTTKGGDILMSAIEVVPPVSTQGRRILSTNIKTNDTEILKKITDKKINHDVRKLAFEVFVNIGVEGFARIDIKSNGSGKLFFMEVNLVPGMTLGSSYFPEAFRIDMGLAYDQTIAHIIDYCLFKELKVVQQYAQLVLIQQDELDFPKNSNVLKI